MVDVADRVQPVAALDAAGVVDGQPGARGRGRWCPGRCRRCGARGRWRRGSRRPPGVRRPSGPRSDTVTAPLAASRTAPVTEVWVRISAPASRSASATSSPAKGSILGSSPPPRTRTVTCAPSACQAVAISTATTPPPTTTRRPGTCWALVASRLVQGFTSARPGRSGSTGAAAGAHGDGVPGGQDVVLALGAGDADLAGAVQPAVAAVEVGADAVEPLDLAVVLPVRGVLVAVGEDRLRRPAGPAPTGAVPAPGGPRRGRPPGAAAPCWACRPSTSTRRRPVRSPPPHSSGRPHGPGRRRSRRPAPRPAPRRRIPRLPSWAQSGVRCTPWPQGHAPGTEYRGGARGCARRLHPRGREEVYVMATVELTKENFDSVVSGQRIRADRLLGLLVRPVPAVRARCTRPRPSATTTWSSRRWTRRPSRSWPQAFDIRSIPTLMIVRDNVAVFAQPGALPEAALEDVIGQAARAGHGRGPQVGRRGRGAVRRRGRRGPSGRPGLLARVRRAFLGHGRGPELMSS